MLTPIRAIETARTVDDVEAGMKYGIKLTFVNQQSNTLRNVSVVATGEYTQYFGE